MPTSTTISPILLAAGAAVVAWRAAALLLFRAQAESGDSLTIQALLALVGLTFVICGFLVRLKVPGPASLLFAVFCLCSGLHWGGPLELAAGPLRTGLLLLYLLASSVLGTIVLLHFALLFPRKARFARPGIIKALYVPLGLAVLLAALFLIAPAESGLRAGAQRAFLILHTIVSNLFAVLALALFVGRLFGADSTADRKKYVGLMVAGMLIAWLPYIVASAVGVEDTDPWNLTVAVLPVTFAIALFGIRNSIQADR